MMSDIIATPQDFYKHIQRTTSSAICSVVWSHRGPTFDSFWGSVSMRSVAKLSATANVPAIGCLQSSRQCNKYALQSPKNARLTFISIPKLWSLERILLSMLSVP